MSFQKTVSARQEEVPNKVYRLVSSIPAVPNDGSVLATINAHVVAESESSLPVSGVEVTFSVSEGGAFPDAEEGTTLVAVTNENGVASVRVSAVGVELIVVKAVTGFDTLGGVYELKVSAPLIVPEVLNASENDGFTLTQSEIALGVSVKIPYYPEVSEGDIVRLYWGKFVYEFLVYDPDEDIPRYVSIEQEQALKLGQYAVYYTVTDHSGGFRVSSGLNITVLNFDGSLMTLTPPAVPESDDGFINMSDAGDGVDVRIIYEGMSTTDNIVFYWYPVDKGGRVIVGAGFQTAVQYNGVSVSADLVVPFECFFPGGSGIDGSVDAFYVVKKESSEEVLISQSRHCRIDTIPPGRL